MEFNNLLPDHNLFGSSFRRFYKASKNGMVGVQLTQKEAVNLFFAGEEIYDQSSGWNKKYDKENLIFSIYLIEIIQNISNLYGYLMYINAEAIRID